MPRKKRILIFSLMLVILSVTFLSTWSRFPAPNQNACRVYETIYADWLRYENVNDAEKFPVFLKSKTQITMKHVRLTERDAPQVFFRETGEFELVEAEYLDEPYQRPIHSEHLFDTSSFFEKTHDGTIQSIKKCDFQKKTDLKFHDGSRDFLILRENILKGSTEIHPEFWSLSNVGFSDDGHFALVYVVNLCEGLCGSGSYILLEKKGDIWKELGVHTVWVS